MFLKNNYVKRKKKFPIKINWNFYMSLCEYSYDMPQFHLSALFIFGFNPREFGRVGLTFQVRQAEVYRWLKAHPWAHY